MSSLTSQRAPFASDGFTQAVSSIQQRTDTEKAEGLLSGRAVLAVTLLGAGFWYALWKLTLSLLAAN